MMVVPSSPKRCSLVHPFSLLSRCTSVETMEHIVLPLLEKKSVWHFALAGQAGHRLGL